MRKLFMLLGLLFFVQSIAQKLVVDSLENLFSQSKSSKDKAITQMELSNYWSYRDTAKAFRHLELARKFVGNDQFLKGTWLFYKAGIYFDYDIQKAQKLYLEADQILKNKSSNSSFEYRAKAWHNYAVLEQLQDKNQSFLNITLEKCIPFAEKSGNKTLLASYLVDVGMVFDNFREFSKSIGYYQKSIETLKTAPSSTLKNETAAWAYLNLANPYMETKQLDLMGQALKNADFYLEKLPESQYKVYSYLQKTKYYSAKGTTKDALENVQKGIHMAKMLNLDYDYFTLNYEYFNILKKEKNWEKGKAVLTSLLNDKKNAHRSKNKLVLLNELIKLEKNLGNYQQALIYSDEFQSLNDSVQKENEKLQILNLEKKYKTNEQEKSLEYLTTKNRQQGIIITISVILLLVVISFFIYALIQRKKRNEQKLYSMQQQRKNEIEQALYEGEIQERERIAKDLHDGIGGRITGIKIHLENLAQQNESTDLQKLTSQLEICLSELRNTARNLTPETLRRFGLEDAIKDFCQNMSTSKTQISCYVKNLNQIEDNKKQIHIFHIVQETVNNAVKHSDANKVLVQCTLENGLLLIDIEDNGKGFSPEKVKRSLGLNNIEKRVHALNGKMDINSSPESGTTINVEAKI